MRLLIVVCIVEYFKHFCHSLLFLTKILQKESSFQIMDILYQQEGPMLQVNAHVGSINCMTVHDTGKNLFNPKSAGLLSVA